jgi:hypothetical protein
VAAVWSLWRVRKHATQWVARVSVAGIAVAILFLAAFSGLAIYSLR